MKITYIKLEHFKRFALRESEVFEHRFSKKLTMITGANGSGKSSLFGELTPLPADKNNFHKDKGGYKEIHITKDNKDYVLISSFKEGVKYSFLCDGEELNPSSNVTAQRELCAIHFSITPAIHELLTGAESFTDMGLASRKKLFNSITHLNIDSILQSYEELKEELRNNEYLAKTLQTRLLVEQQKLMDDTRKSYLLERLSGLNSHIEHLLDIHTQLYQYRKATGFEEASASLVSALTKLKLHYSKHMVRLTANPESLCNSKEATLKTQIQHHQAYLQSCYKDMEELLHEKKSIAFARQTNKKAVEEETTQLETMCANLIGHLSLVDYQTTNLADVSAQLNILERSLPEVLETLPPNPDRKLSKAAYTALVEEKNTILTLMHEKLKESTTLQAELTQLNKHQNLTCPACEHTWLPHEVTGLLQSTGAKLQTLDKERYLLEERVKELTKEEAKLTNYLSQIHQVNSLYSSTKTTLGKLWEEVTRTELLYKDPSRILSLVAKAIKEVIDVQKYNQLQVKLTTLKESLYLIGCAGTSSEESNSKAIVSLEASMNNCMEAMSVKLEALADVQIASGLHRTLQQLQRDVKSGKDTMRLANLKHTVDAVMGEIDSQLSVCKVSVIETQNELTKHSAIEQTVKALEVEVADSLENIKVLTLLTNELSPKNGFIAKSISQFLNAIIGSMNSVIAGVWDYKMVLKAIDVGTDALNYRFKLEVEDRLTVDDISKASAGMKEIINLAMKVTLFKLLRLENTPFYLDEFAVRLDASHRARVADVIFKMLASPMYSQVFLITHLDLAYGNFKDTEVIEL